MNKGIVLMVSLLLVFESQSFAASRSRDASISSIGTDQAQIRLLLGSVEQTIQQTGSSTLPQYLLPQSTPFEFDSLPSAQQHLIESLNEIGSNLSQTFDSQHRGWQITPFSWFNVEIDTVLVFDSSATVRIHADWKRRVESDPCVDYCEQTP